MNNNKALMCLLTASISALAAAPALASNTESKEGNSIIDIEKLSSEANLNEVQLQQKKDLRAQIDILLSRKAPQMKIGESVDIMIDSYGRNNLSLKSELFEKMGFGVNIDCNATANKNHPVCNRFDSQSNIRETDSTKPGFAGDAGSKVRSNASQSGGSTGGNVAGSCDVKNVGGSDMTACPKGTYQFTACHSACHGVCHGACHGARGWR